MSEWETEGQGGATEGVEDDEPDTGSEEGETGGDSEEGMDDDEAGSAV